jgi:hypothetical protein
VKNSDIETLEAVFKALRQYLPLGEYDLYAAYKSVFERLKAKNNTEKQKYQEKAEYHRETTRKWRRDNKERHSAYQKKYYYEKQAEKKKNKEKGGSGL